MHYEKWGFRDNPFMTTSLPPTEEGSKLLIDRADLIRKIQMRLSAGSKILTIEGLNGVGKTSLVNVAVYRHFRDRLSAEKGALLIPCKTQFQLQTDEVAEAFSRRVLIEVMQTLITARNDLPIPSGMVKTPDASAVDRWLNAPIFSNRGADISILGSGLGISTGGAPNESSGFNESGLLKAITDYLEMLFPNRKDGGVVCLIDNLELLQTSKNAREVFERLRDVLFSLPGIRWVLCGALGIVNGIASSPRMDGYLHRPIEVEDLSHDVAAEIFNTRVGALRTRSDARLPMGADQFELLFDVYRGNLRSALAACDEFCGWVAEEHGEFGLFDDDLFKGWFRTQMHDAYEAAHAELRPRAFEVFAIACDFEVFSPSDCAEFGYKTPNALRPQIKSLEEAGLLVSSQDETDKRRKTIQVLPKGWKVKAYLDRFVAKNT
jgi:DNA-binding MarR family transcriptional regulator